MNVATRWKTLTGMALTLACATQMPAWSEQPAEPASTAPLRWTPYRTAAPDSGERAPALLPPAQSAGAAAPTATPPAAQPRMSTAPAPRAAGPFPAAMVPEGVPPIPGQMPPRSFQSPANSLSRPLPRTAAGMPRGAAGLDTDGSMFGMKLLRAPQGDQGRPLLGAEGFSRQVGGMGELGPGRASDVRMTGGDAPRFDPRATAMARTRGQRVALSADGMPSVMARSPQAADTGAEAARPRVTARRASAPPASAAPLPTPAQAPVETAPPQPAFDPRSLQFDRQQMMEGEMMGPSMGQESMTMDGMPMDGMPGGMSGGMPGGMEGYAGEGYASEGYGSEYGDGMMLPGEGPLPGGPEGWKGDYQLHVPSPFDDPYACEDGDCYGCLPGSVYGAQMVAWLRQFGRPYYGWRWYRDFTASVGVTSFQNTSDLGIHGNYGFNQYANWAMPFWNALGVGWQIGIRGVEANFQPTQVKAANGALIFNNQSRNQTFLTTGFFTRAFEGRGLQGGIVYDYLSDNWYDNVDLAQIRGELSYVWGYNEVGFWGTYNVANTNGIFTTGSSPTNFADTLDLYTGFYRLHFGDANELKVWGGASGQGDFLTGALVRAPMNRSLALEGTFTYLIPSTSQTVALPRGNASLTYAEQAWQTSVNLVYYPACRARRSLASPYRPLFEVADNGSMIRSVSIPQHQKIR